MFGFNNPALFSLLQKADAETNLDKRARACTRRRAST